ncbi:MAG: hypothetical protein WBC91_02360 [Phototrophicaceae bacterium]
MTSKAILYSIFTISIASLWLVFQPLVTAQASVDLSITATTDMTVIPVNSNFTYLVQVENLSTDDASFVTVTDQLPLGIIFLSSPDACVITGSTVDCRIGDLEAGQSLTLSYVVRASLEGDTVNNAVSVLAAETDNDTSNNVASVSIAVIVPDNVDIALSGSVSALRLDISNELILSFVITNADSTDAYRTGVEFVMPAQVAFISSEDCANAGTVIVCEAGTIPSGTAQSLSLVVRALTAGNPVTISAITSHFMTDPDTSNNGASLTFVINQPPPDSADLQFTMTTTSAQLVIGEPLLISYTLVNLGPNTASNVQIMDALPSDLTFISSDNCTLVNNSMRCDVGDLSSNDIYTGAVTVTANRVSDNIVSSASVIGNEFDPNLFNNSHAIALTSINETLLTATAPAVTPAATIIATATITATSLPAIQVISTQTSPQVAPVPQEGQSATSNNDRSSNPITEINSPLPDGIAPSDIYGWRRYESVDLIQVMGRWRLRSMSNASDGAYHEARDAGALLRYPFEGDGFRIGYRSEVNGAGIQVSLDGEFVNVIETNFLAIDPELAPLRQSFVTQPYWVDTGYHLVDLMCLADGAGSQGCNIDYIEIFIGPPIPASAQPTAVAISENELVVVVSDVELVSAPPTLAPTSTAIAASVITVDVIVSADLNANTQVDANEGIEGMTVRAVNVSDNSLLATSMTDASGFVRITNSTTSDVILLIPALGESFYIRNRGQALNETWNLLLDPVNIPGLIP